MQYLVPDSLETWIQRAGRAGRSTEAQTEGWLIVQRNVFYRKTAGKKGESQADGTCEDGTEYIMNIDDGFRKYITAHERGECRRRIADIYFDNPPGDIGMY